MSAFGALSVIYGQIAENGHDVRKRPARKMAITDKPTKNGPLSVNLDEILAKLVDQRCFKKVAFSHAEN